MFSFFTLVLSLSSLVSCADLPKLLQNAIKQYKTVVPSEFIQSLRYQEELTAELTTEHKVITAHYNKLRGTCWRDVWANMFNSLIGKNYFKGCGQKGVNRGRVAFLKILFRNEIDAIEYGTTNEAEYLKALNDELTPYELTFPDIGSAYCFTAFALVYRKSQMADSDAVFQDFLKSGGTAAKLRKRKTSANPYSMQPKKKFRATLAEPSFVRSDGLETYSVKFKHVNYSLEEFRSQSGNANTPVSRLPQNTLISISLGAQSKVQSEIQYFFNPPLNVHQSTPEVNNSQTMSTQGRVIIDVGQNESPIPQEPQTDVMTEQQEYISPDEECFIKALEATECTGNSSFSFTYLNEAFSNTTERRT